MVFGKLAQTNVEVNVSVSLRSEKHDSAVLLVGGMGGALLSPEVLLSGNTNCQVPDLPKSVSDGSLLLTPGDNKILHCGGMGDMFVDAKCFELIKGQEWRKHSLLGWPRHGRMQVSMKNGNYVFSTFMLDRPPGEPRETTSDFLPKNSNTWQVGPKVPGEEMIAACVVRISDEEFVVLGGRDRYFRYYSNRIIKYNTRTQSWDKRWGNLRHGRSSHGCTYVDGNIIVAGGVVTRYNIPLRSTEIISVATGDSKLVGNMQEERSGLALVTVGEGLTQKVLAIGGRNGHNTALSSVEIFDGNFWSMAPFSLQHPREHMAYLPIADDLVCA